MSTAWGLRGPATFSCLHSVLSHPQHILYCIVDSECKSRDVLQSYFDLLGELMKFNVDAFKRFNKYINTFLYLSLNMPRSITIQQYTLSFIYSSFLLGKCLLIFVILGLGNAF